MKLKRSCTREITLFVNIGIDLLVSRVIIGGENCIASNKFTNDQFPYDIRLR